MTVFGECMAASTNPRHYTLSVRDRVLEHLVSVMDAFRFASDMYTNEYMVRTSCSVQICMAHRSTMGCRRSDKVPRVLAKGTWAHLV